MGGTVVLIGSNTGETLIGDDGTTRVKTHASFVRSTPGVYDALIAFGDRVPGRALEDFAVQKLIRRFDRMGGVIVAVDHGPLLLSAAGVVKGRIMTGWPTIWEDLRKAGAFAPAAPVTVDGNLVTVMGPDHIDDVCMLLPRMIERRKKSAA